MNEAHLYAVWLTTVFGFGSKTVCELIGQFGGIRELVERGADELHFGKFSEKAALAFRQKDFSYAESVMETCEKEGAQILCIEDAWYPPLLKEMPAPPLALFCKGNLERLTRPLITVIGSRKTDDEGKKLADIYTEHFRKAGLQIVSGFAEGIETRIHQKNNGTIAVLPTDLKRVYPKGNWRLKQEILESDGLLITEFPYGISAYKGSFHLRNRIMAGLSMGTLVVQAGEKSGTFITAGDAASYGRTVYVIPGSTLNRRFDGSFELLQNGAEMVLSPHQIVEDYARMYQGLVKSMMPEKTEAAPALDLTDGSYSADEQKLLTQLLKQPMGMEALSDACSMAAARTAATLAMLELRGVIRKTVENLYQIK